MVKETIFEFKTKQLLDEYKLASEELMKKDCYVTGLRKMIEQMVQDYYNRFNGKWYKMYVEEIGESDVDVRIGKIKVEFYGNSLEIKVYLLIDPNAVINSLECTAKEKKLLSKAKKLWNSDAKYSYIYEFYNLEDISDKLEMQDNSIQILEVKHYSISELALLTWADVCTERLVLGKDSASNQVLLGMFEQR